MGRPLGNWRKTPRDVGAIVISSSASCAAQAANNPRLIAVVGFILVLYSVAMRKPWVLVLTLAVEFLQYKRATVHFELVVSDDYRDLM